MDDRLRQKLASWHKQIEEVEAKEGQYLQLEANEKPLFGSLFLAATGKSIAEKEAQVHASQDWRDFKRGLVGAEVEYLKSKRMLELKQAAFNASYLEAKHDFGAIQRLPAGLP